MLIMRLNAGLSEVHLFCAAREVGLRNAVCEVELHHTLSVEWNKAASLCRWCCISERVT